MSVILSVCLDVCSFARSGRIVAKWRTLRLVCSAPLAARPFSSARGTSVQLRSRHARSLSFSFFLLSFPMNHRSQPRRPPITTSTLSPPGCLSPHDDHDEPPNNLLLHPHFFSDDDERTLSFSTGSTTLSALVAAAFLLMRAILSRLLLPPLFSR